MADGNLNRMKALTGAYYDLDEENDTDIHEARENAGNLDSSYFNVDQKVGEMLRKTPYLQLLDVDEELRKTIVHLDNQMQLLVYENYSKFIGATDTMQNMKEKLVKMESQVSGLESRMEAIANGTRRMNERNSTKREEVARLDRLGGLVGKLSTLFELPKKLRSETDVKEIRGLVQLFKSALPYLTTHSSVPSFAKIERDARDATIEILGRLKYRYQASEEIANLAPDELDAMTAILLDLGEAPFSLAPVYFKWHRDYIFKTAVSKDEAVRESFETCSFLLKTTMFEPLNQVLMTGETFFPEATCGEEITNMKISLTKDIFRSILDKLRSRFDAEPLSFLARDEEEGGGAKQQDGEEDPVDRIIRALAQSMKEFTAWDRSLPTPTLARALGLTDRAQELAERVVRRQVNGIMTELKQRTELHLLELDNAEDFRMVLDKTSQNLVSDASEAKNHFSRLLKKAAVVMAPAGEMTSSFDDLFKFQMRDWSEFLSSQLKSASNCTNSNTLLLKALLARTLSNRAKELSVYDQKQLTKSLIQASDDALKVFCTAKGLEAAEMMGFSVHEPKMQNKPSRVGDGVVFMLNKISALSKLMKVAQIPSKRMVGGGASNPIAAAVGSSTQAAPATYTRGSAASAASAATGGVAGGARTGASFQILKMFAEKLVVFDKVDFDGTSIAAGALRVALKTWYEHIREEVLNRYEFQQIQLDANFIRTFVPMLTGDSAPSVTKLIAEVVASARERCTDPSTMDAVALDMLCNDRKDDVKF